METIHLLKTMFIIIVGLVVFAGIMKILASKVAGLIAFSFLLAWLYLSAQTPEFKAKTQTYDNGVVKVDCVNKTYSIHTVVLGKDYDSSGNLEDADFNELNKYHTKIFVNIFDKYYSGQTKKYTGSVGEFIDQFEYIDRSFGEQDGFVVNYSKY